MSRASSLPDLTFPAVEYGPKETLWDLRALLYRGGAAIHSSRVMDVISNGSLGEAQNERIRLVEQIHEEILSDLNIGGSRETALSRISNLRLFFGWADRSGHTLNLETIATAYYAWTDFLTHRTRLKKTEPNKKSNPDREPLSMSSAYTYSASVGALLDRILNRRTRIIESTRLKRPNRRKTAIGIRAEKQNLEHTFSFGHLLQDICDSLTIKTVTRPLLPVQINLRTTPNSIREINTNAGQPSTFTVAKSNGYSLKSLRIEAELMMFIGQTGMNLTQAQNLELRHFSYLSHAEGFQVKAYKARRNGVVLFEIFKDYRQHFEKYLEWRRTLFSTDKRIFPLDQPGRTREASKFRASRLRKICTDLNIPFIGPQSLRNTRVNWLLRHSSNPDLTAESSQHTKQTLLGVYHRPSLQRAMAETTQFWQAHDPSLIRTQAIAPGGCTGHPKSSTEAPSEAVKPDCSKASGCLWCKDYRDIDSQDYVWALASFKHLKLIELAKTQTAPRVDDRSPVDIAVTRLSDKLQWFMMSSEIRRAWVVEAQTRIEEGDYHPEWKFIIEKQEVAT